MCCFNWNTANAYDKLYAPVKCPSTLNPKLGEHSKFPYNFFFAFLFIFFYCYCRLPVGCLCICCTNWHANTKTKTRTKRRLWKLLVNWVDSFFLLSNTKQRSDGVRTTDSIDLKCHSMRALTLTHFLSQFIP